MSKSQIQSLSIVGLGFFFFFVFQQILYLEHSIYLSFTLIALIGIPHGAIDHLLHKERTGKLNIDFYIFYLGVMALYGLTWFIVPSWSLTFFMFLSVFHFGQSQFADYPQNLWTKFLLPISWGMCLLSALVFLNMVEIEHLKSDNEVYKIFFIFEPKLFKYLFFVSSGLLLICLSFAYLKQVFSIRTVVFELALITLLLLSFYYLDIMPGFTLYFVGIHSLMVMRQEFIFLRERKAYSLTTFLKLLAPFSIVSIIGSILLIYLSLNKYLPIGNVKLLLILISLITLPHSIVMDKFYKS